MTEVNKEVTDHVVLIPTTHTLPDSEPADVVAFLSDKLKYSLIYSHEKENWLEETHAAFIWLIDECGFTPYMIVDMIYKHRTK